MESFLPRWVRFMEDDGRESELVLDLGLATLRLSCEARPLLLSMGGGVEDEEDMFVPVRVGRDQLAQEGSFRGQGTGSTKLRPLINFVGEPCCVVVSCRV